MEKNYIFISLVDDGPKYDFIKAKNKNEAIIIWGCEVEGSYDYVLDEFSSKKEMANYILESYKGENFLNIIECNGNVKLVE